MKIDRSLLVRALAPVCCLVPAALAASVTFHGVGDLPGGIVYSEIRDAVRTPSGIVAVGGSAQYPFSISSDTVVRWTPGGGLEALPGLVVPTALNVFVSASAVSADGNVIASRSRLFANTNARVATIHTGPSATLTVLGQIPGGGPPGAGANAVSADGSVVWGFSTYPGSAGALQAFRWTSATGFVPIPLPPGYIDFTPTGRAVTADGATIAGLVGTVPFAINNGRAVRYTHGVGYQFLPLLPGGTFNNVAAITPDGSFVVGAGNSPDFPAGQLCRWDAAGNVEALGNPHPTLAPEVFGGITTDGRVIAISFVDPAGSHAYIRNDHGWWRLDDILDAAGVDLTGWIGLTFFGMSPDATVAFGFGLHHGNREGFVAEFPPGFLANLGADLTPPVFQSISVNPAELWPANHRLVAATVSAVVTDDRDPAPTVRLVSITCNEAHSGDAEITGDLTANLRATRGGNGTGRIYTLVVEATDAAGNVATATVDVTVPHDRRK